MKREARSVEIMGLVAEIAQEEVLSEYELERGKPMPSKNHGLVQALLIGIFLRYAEYSILSEVALDLEPPLIPDISVYPKLQADWVHDEIRMTDVPLMVVEILSPKQYLSELIEKIEDYFQAGVKTCWLVQPTFKSIIIFSPDMQSQVYTSGEVIDPVTKIAVKLEDVFR